MHTERAVSLAGTWASLKGVSAPLPAPGVGEGREPWGSLRGGPALGSFLQPHGPQAGGSRDPETPAASS